MRLPTLSDWVLALRLFRIGVFNRRYTLIWVAVFSVGIWLASSAIPQDNDAAAQSSCGQSGCVECADSCVCGQ